ncbi:hypothetical protein ADM98_03995 [Exiguobacterium sp. BMC-KP]|uniref:hypothetical protein n=1 Tax=Exiguobacterium sp. BMC-KP TaxID=1684312 RepID=UPI0006AA5404|nr:hypothetical protein [Exiguobacterium sp. BMC-KP]KOP30625.1 hypothetical protein ADM98_03995 [Exiguobacterium sp. BMC-KP]
MEKQYFDLMQFFEGYVRNYRRMNLSQLHNRSMFTKREIDYFANLGEMLGFSAFVEDSKFDKAKGRSRPMDLSWWKWDARIDDEHFLFLALHLERENVWNKDVETIEKLFSQTDKEYIPHNVIGTQYIESAGRIQYLNKLVLQKNEVQQSNCLMIYRYYDVELSLERVSAYSFNPKGLKELRRAICKQDDSGYWYMSFEEEYVPFQKKSSGEQ